MEHAIAFSETGHLAMGTLHANNANQALDRIINFFPEDRRQQLLMDLSLNLKAIVSLRLIPREGSTGRVPAVELLLTSPYIADLIQKGEVHEIKEQMKKSKALGMQTFDQSLIDLYERNEISQEDALRFADSKGEVQLAIRLQSSRFQKTDPTVPSKPGDPLLELTKDRRDLL
jgi:twitching motility protein PilU